jgi:hypothetical protein
MTTRTNLSPGKKRSKAANNPQKINRECTRMDAKTMIQIQLQINADRLSKSASVNLGRAICVHQCSSVVCFFSCPFASIRG